MGERVSFSAPDGGPPAAALGCSAEDERTWAKVRDELFAVQDRFAFADYGACRAAVLGDVSRRLPRPEEVSRRLARRTGFGIRPVGGIILASEFFESLRQGSFTANVNVRRPEEWRFCPIPDWIHESVGHAACLGDERVARLYRLFGEAAGPAPGKELLRRLGRLFWHTFEAGLVRERGQVRAFGAAILSSASRASRRGLSTPRRWRRSPTTTSARSRPISSPTGRASSSSA
jgi:phenylalanine-4-hydroxylase